MAVDRGGLNYRIVVEDAFSKATEKFRTEIDAARASFAAFKAESNGLAAVNSRITVTLNQATAASSRKTTQLSAETEAERRLTRILRERIVGEELRTLAQEKGVDLSKKKIRQLSVEQEAERKLIKQTRDAAVARKVEEQAQKRGIDLSKKKIAALTVEEEAQKKVEAAIRRKAILERTSQIETEKGITVSKQKVKQLTVEEEALRRVEKAERARAVAARVAQLNAQRFIGPPAPGAATPPSAPGSAEFIGPVKPKDLKETLSGLQQARQRVDLFRQALAQANTGGSDLLFTFRRLFGVLAAFQAARAIFTSFVEFIRTGVEFNATIERTRLGIASVIIAVGKVSDEQDKALEGAEAFAAAQQESARQQRALRVEALKTTATFQELLDTFQTAVGPGVAAGLNLDQIREFSVRISQAASAIGVAQNQLSEEIRSILSGTIQQRTTRIAAVLQITNEDIRNAREAGTLFQFLEDRFKTFGLAGEEAGKTFDGLTAILKGALQELAGVAAAPLFDELKTTLKGLIDLILTIGPNGAVLINPDAISAVAPIFQGILVAVNAVKDAARGLGFKDVASSAKLLGGALALAGVAVAGVIDGIVKGFNVVVGIISSLLPEFDGQKKSLTEIISLVTKYTVIFGSAVAVVGLMGFAITALLAPLNQIITLVTTITTGVTKLVALVLRLPAPILKSLAGAAGLAAIFLALGEVVRQITEAIFGVNLTLKDTIELIALGFIGGIVEAIGFVLELGLKIQNSISEAFTSAAESAVAFINDGKQLLASFIGNQKEVEALESEAEQARKDADRARFLRRKQFELELANIQRENSARSLAFNKEIAEVVGKAAGLDALDKIPGTLSEILGGIGSLFSGLDFGFSELGKGGTFSLDKILDLDGFNEKLQAALAAANQEAPKIGVEARGIPVTDEQRQSLLEATQKLAITRQQLEAQRAINDLEAVQASDNALRIQELVNQSAELQTQFDTQKALNELEVERAEKAIGGAQGDEQRAQLEQELLVLKQQQVVEQENLTEKIRATNIELEREKQIANGSISEGLLQGTLEFSNQFASSFDAGIAIAKGALESFSSFVSDTITSAFDPNNDTTIKERFGKFLQDLAKLILNEIIKLQVAKLVASFGAGAITGGSIGMAEGGQIPRRGTPSPAHYGIGVKGLAKGGRATPPPGVDRRDTVPIWAQPGEFMQNLSAVRTYGRDFMEALNNRVLDPRALRGLAGLQSSKRMAARSHRGPGFAAGGLISDQIARQTAAQAFQASAPAGGGGGVQRAVVVAGEAEFDKMIAGGEVSLIRFFQQNKDTIRGILNR